MADIPNIFVLTDEKTGCNNQSIGVAQSIGGNIHIIRSDKALSEMGRNGPRSGPDIVISASPGTQYPAERIKMLQRDKVFNIKLGPLSKRDYDNFDLIARYDPPAFQDCHLGPKPEKVMFTTGVAHCVTPVRIAEGVEIWDNQFCKLPHPRIGVLMGGDTSTVTPLTAKMAAKIGKDLNTLAKETGGSLIISTSRRTSDEAVKALAQEITVPTYIHDFNRSQGNPHFGLLGISDTLIATGDSMSMVMEACSTGKPTYYFPVPDVEMPYHQYLQKELTKAGQVRPFEGKLEQWSYSPPDVAGEIAAKAKEMMRQKGQSR